MANFLICLGKWILRTGQMANFLICLGKWILGTGQMASFVICLEVEVRSSANAVTDWKPMLR
jgi:hypothetical protein